MYDEIKGMKNAIKAERNTYIIKRAEKAENDNGELDIKKFLNTDDPIKAFKLGQQLGEAYTAERLHFSASLIFDTNI